jgi:hypothetical protein
MRKLAFVFVAFAAMTGVLVGCGGSNARKPGATGKAGTGGGAGTGGAGGGTAGSGTTGAAGDGAAGTGTAGTGAAGTGEAGTGAAGTGAAGTNAAGTGGGAGTTGAAGEPPPPPPPCDAKPKKPLPYDISADYSPVIINGNNNMNAWVVVDSPSCDTTTYPPLNPEADGGVDGGDAAATDAASDGAPAAEAGTDAADDATATLQLDDPDAGDGGVADAAQDVPVGSDAAADAGASSDGGASEGGGSDGGASEGGGSDGGAVDGGADAKPKAACYEMTYNPTPCVTGGGNACWGGVIFATTSTLGPDAPAMCIAAGATKITFMARASRDGARIKFGAIGAGEGSTEFFTNITTSWAQYTITSPATSGSPYNMSSTMGGVWNGFSVVAEPNDHAGGTYIFVKDITWAQ